MVCVFRLYPAYRLKCIMPFEFLQGARNLKLSGRALCFFKAWSGINEYVGTTIVIGMLAILTDPGLM